MITNKGVIELWLAEPWILQRCPRGGLGRKISLYEWASPLILSGSVSFVLSFVFKYNVIPHELHLKKKKKSFTAVGCCAQPCLLFGGPLDCNPPNASAQGNFQAGMLQWGTISTSRGPSQPRVWACASRVSCIARQILTTWATWEAAKANVLEK